MKKALINHEPLTEDDEMLPEYDLSGGVRGKYARAFREGYTVKVHHKDGTTETSREEVTSLFRNYGYLSGQAQKKAAEMEAKHADYFELFYRASSFAQRLLLDLRLPSGDIQKLVVAGLMARLLEDSQGCALLVKHGIAKTSAVTLRTSFECLVLLKSCCTEGDFADRFAASDTLEYLRLTRAAQGNAELDEKQREELKLREDELGSEKKANNIQRLPPIETLARNAGMDRYYQTIYRLTSGHTHISPRSLKSYYSFSGGKAGKIAFGPNDDSTALYLYTLSDFLLIGAGLTGQLFDLDRNRVGMEIRAEHKKLSPKQPDESDE